MYVGRHENPDRFLHSISKSSILALYLHTNNYSNGFWVDIKVCFFYLRVKFHLETYWTIWKLCSNDKSESCKP